MAAPVITRHKKLATYIENGQEFAAASATRFDAGSKGVARIYTMPPSHIPTAAERAAGLERVQAEIRRVYEDAGIW